jgi:L-cysteine/cystine lyase
VLDLEAVRGALPVLATKAYLNSGTFGPLPQPTLEAMAARQQRELLEGRSGQRYFEEVRARREELRAALARLIGAPPGAVALTPSTSAGCNIVVSSLRLQPDDEVVTTDCEHPGLTGALHVSGARIRMAAVRSRPAGEALASIEAEISSRTRLIAVSHVLWTTGAVVPVEALAGRGIPVLVDGAQAVGALEVDVAKLGCEFYTVSGQKWLLGPDATGALYVGAERLDDLRIAFPSFLSWQRGTLEPKPGAERFDAGAIPTASVAGLIASLAFAEQAGPERLARARSQAERCRELLAERVRVVTEPGQAGLVSFEPPADPEGLVHALEQTGVVIRDLPGTGWARASVGFWTSDDDLDRLAAGITAFERRAPGSG